MKVTSVGLYTGLAFLGSASIKLHLEYTINKSINKFISSSLPVLHLDSKEKNIL